MKIAVYTIALNEEKHVKRWYESAKDADYLLIADTGSTDKTVKLAKKLGINVINISIKPWRFDDSRNAALAALPEDIDYCISMDMDETLSPGWREHLEKMTADRITYLFNLSYRDETETVPENRMVNDRIHKREGFRWTYLMHEAIVPSRNPNFTEEFCKGLEVSHHPDREKPRTQYNPMIKDAYEEYGDYRYSVYYAADLLGRGELKEASKVFKETLKKHKQPSEYETALIYRLLSICNPKLQKHYLRKSLRTLKTREVYIEYAIRNYIKENWLRAWYYSKRALSITNRPTSVLSDERFWGYLPHNILSVAKYNAKLFKYSKKYKTQKRTIIIGSIITHNFKIFED
jgi:glycosyltransferase involved in cell wall biosynthesis